MKSQLSLACLYVVIILFSFCYDIVKMDLKDDGNNIFITQNTFRENLDMSVDRDTPFNALDILFNIGDQTFANIKLKMQKCVPAVTIGHNELVQTCEQIDSTACKEVNNVDYQPTYEDVSNNEDLPTGKGECKLVHGRELVHYHYI